MRTALIIAAAAAGLVAASAASAQTDIAPASRTVTTANTDFRDPAAVHRLYERIQVAAMEACDQHAIYPGRSINRDPECTAATTAAAIQRIDRPLLTAEYQQHEAIRTARGY